MTDYRSRALHAVTLACGQPLAPGETGTVDPEDPHDGALIEAGLLIRVEAGTDYGAMKHDQLVAIATEAGLEVKGTGKDGVVINADLVKALTENDRKERG